VGFRIPELELYQENETEMGLGQPPGTKRYVRPMFYPWEAS
jgi:hypothetical protein